MEDITPKKSTPRKLSLGRQCTAFGCSVRQYNLNEGKRIKSENNFFAFPKDKFLPEKWCNLIKWRNGFDGFCVTNATFICNKHFVPSIIFRASGGTK